MSTSILRNTTENPNPLKQLFGLVLPLAMKRQLLYLKHYRRFGNFRTPRLLSEKIQWRIINDRRELLRYTCDKRASKLLALEAARRAGVNLMVPRELAWAAEMPDLLQVLREKHLRRELPSRWVVKPNHSSGRAILVEGEPEWSFIDRVAGSWTKDSRFEKLHWIWPYTIAERGLLAEEFIQASNSPTEWQVWMFNGRIEYVVAQQRIGEQPHRSCFDREWRLVPSWFNRDTDPLRIPVPPRGWANIEAIAHALGDEWDMIRIDFYEDDQGGLWFGELTLYPAEGLFSTSAESRRFDAQSGEHWLLPASQSS